jgi:hypothetical protein
MDRANVHVSGAPGQVTSLDASRFREHFRTFYELQRPSFDSVAPAYEFGARLRRRSTDGDWSAIESRISMNWERKNPGSGRFRDAIRAGWDSAGEKR